VPFTVRPADITELDEGDPAEVAVENALRKARAVAVAVADADAPATVLGVDTLVALEGRIYGKPADEAHARRTLGALGGATHTVFSGVALLSTGPHSPHLPHLPHPPLLPERTALAATEVVFRPLDEGLIDWYVATGEWRGRAGGYAIQGAGAALVREVRGDYENVVGLPLATLLDLCPWLLGP
jgi:septum formation protein